MKKMRFWIAAALICVCAIFVLSGCSKTQQTQDNGITSIEIKGKDEKREVRIKAEFTDEFVDAHKGQDIHLIAKDPSNTSGKYTSLASKKIKNSIKFELPYQTDGKSYLNTAFVCAYVENGTFVPIGNERYIEDVSELGQGASRPLTGNIKGLATDNISHASYLGTDHILLEVRIDKMLLETYEEGAQSCISQGLTYYFDGEQVEYFDKVIKQATDAKMSVYLQFILCELDELTEDEIEEGKIQKEKIECLYFPGASPKATAFMPNITDKKAQGYMTALFDFFAQRYSGSDHGVAIDYIIGKNVNNIATYNNAGETEAKDAADCYSALVRMAYNCLVSRVSNGRVYISLDNAWRKEAGGALTYLNNFNSTAKATGDYPWGVALSYGNLSGDTAWADSDANTVSANSLGDIKGVLNTDAMLHKKEQRRVIISEFSIPVNKESANSEDRRAASYAYVYYSTLNADFADALFYTEYVDDQRGLLTNNLTATKLCDVYAICSSNRTQELSFIDSIIGDKWKALKKSESFEETNVIYSPIVTKEVKTSNPKRLFDFSKGDIYGFKPAGGAEYVSLVDYAQKDGKSNTCLIIGGAKGGWKTAFCKAVGKSELDSSKYLGITAAGQYSGQKAYLVITGISKKSDEKFSICMATTLTAEPKEYFFDISDFADKLSSSDDVSFSVCIPEDTQASAGEVYVYKINLYGSSGSQVWKYILIILIIILVAVGIFVGIRLFEKRSKHGKGKSKSASKKSNSSAKRSGSASKKEKEPSIVVDEDDGDEDFDEDYDLDDDEDGEDQE